MEQNRSAEERGTGEVHTVMADEPSKGIGESGKYHAEGPAPSGTVEGMKEKATNRAHDMADQAKEKAHHAMDDASGRARQMMDDAERKLDQVQDRAQNMASQVGDRASEMLDEAEETIEERTHAISAAREYPLAAVGIAFGVGFLLAGSSDHDGAMGKAKGRLRGALMGGLTSAATNQLKSYVESHGGVSGVMDQMGA